MTTKPAFDFIATDHGTVWKILAVSASAKRFAEEHFEVEPWQGEPTNFAADWRPARDLCERLDDEHGFIIGRL